VDHNLDRVVEDLIDKAAAIVASKNIKAFFVCVFV
jgi:hypothetical protein